MIFFSYFLILNRYSNKKTLSLPSFRDKSRRCQYRATIDLYLLCFQFSIGPLSRYAGPNEGFQCGWYPLAAGAGWPRDRGDSELKCECYLR